MKKNILTVLFSLTITSAAFANAGDVNFTNNNLNAVKSNDAVQFKIVNQNNDTAYTQVLSAASGANVGVLTAGAFGNTTTFDVYIVDSAISGDTFQKCLSGIPYNPTWAPQNIYGWDTGNGQFACSTGTSGKK